MEKKELVIFESADQEVSLSVQTDGDTMWLTQKQMEQLFDVRQATISEHISNILDSGELDETSIGFSDRRDLTVRIFTHPLKRRRQIFCI